MGRLGVTAAALCMSFTLRATAQSSGAFQLDYRASPGCPTAAEFVARVVQYTPLARLAASGEPSHELHVVIETDAGGATGRLAFVALDGSASERTVAARDCTEVTDALALVAAIVIDPNAERALPETAPPSQTAPAGRNPERAGPARPLVEPPPRPARTIEAVEGSLPWRLGPAFQAGVVGSGLTPNLGIALFSGIELVLEREALLAPSLRLSGYHVRSADVATAAGSASFEWTAARLSACPLRWSAAFVGIRPCLFGDVGRLRAEGYATVNREEHSTLWTAIGAALRTEATLLEVLAVEVEFGAAFPLSNDRFFFEPDQNAYEIGPGVYALAGVGLRFP